MAHHHDGESADKQASKKFHVKERPATHDASSSTALPATYAVR
jgi:hypothetical protein